MDNKLENIKILINEETLKNRIKELGEQITNDYIISSNNSTIENTQNIIENKIQNQFFYYKNFKAKK